MNQYWFQTSILQANDKFKESFNFARPFTVQIHVSHQSKEKIKQMKSKQICSVCCKLGAVFRSNFYNPTTTQQQSSILLAGYTTWYKRHQKLDLKHFKSSDFCICNEQEPETGLQRFHFTLQKSCLLCVYKMNSMEQNLRTRREETEHCFAV